MNGKHKLSNLFSQLGDKMHMQNNLPAFTQAKIRLASHPDTSPDSLKKLANHKCNHLVSRVAEHPSTPLETLQTLSQHEHPEVRSAIADNVNTPQSILMNLTKDSDIQVRYSLAENHNVPISVICVLLEDENPYVAARAGKTLNRLRMGKKRFVSWFPNLWQNQRRDISG
ncbi:MAG: hypothetical protein K2X81_29355 [Candidatus Obscuribacterales bacterium]|nr:hypothetical protein [Candidatus Obscuribacterales bacterium]